MMVIQILSYHSLKLQQELLVYFKVCLILMLSDFSFTVKKQFSCKMFDV